MKRNALLTLTTVIGALAINVTPAAAQVCEDGDLASKLQYFRRLSLDLRGRIPAVEELQAIVDANDVDPALIDEMIASEEFVGQMRDYHRDLLWTNVTGVQISVNAWQIRPPRTADQIGPWYIRANVRTTRYRGAPGLGCLNQPAEFDANGDIVAYPHPTIAGAVQEGFVDITPYWDPNVTIPVCAFDAQTNLRGDRGNGNTVACNASPQSSECGCGPGLAWCQRVGQIGVPRTDTMILGSMNEQLLRFADDIIRADRPYTDLLLGKDMEINGPIVHWLTNQTGSSAGRLPSSPVQNFAMPDLGFDQVDTWTRVDREDKHAGVLSMPGYLVKFASNRGRANRFYNAFLCQTFQPLNPLPPATDACHQEPDLTVRCGCKDCHTTLEPAAAHWGRWGEAALLPLNEAQFPTMNQACVTNPNSFVCRNFYFTSRDVTEPDKENQYVGMLRSYVFSTPAIETNIEAGPEKIAQEAVDAGVFAQCTTKKMWTMLMAREFDASEADVLEALSTDFATDYSIKRLIQNIVTRDEYRFGGVGAPAE